MPDQIPFTRGVPSADLLPVDDLRSAAETAFADPTSLSYGSGAGHAGLCAWIAARHGTDADRVLCANGSLQAFAFLTSVLLDGATTRRVLVEAPTYDRSILILRRAGAEVVGVPQDADGLDVDALAAEVDRNGPPAFAYVIPNFQNPSGATLTLERRRALVALASERGFLLVEDDPYGLLRWRGERLPTLHELDGGDNVVTMSSFTKTIAPGLRAGYAISPARAHTPPLDLRHQHADLALHAVARHDRRLLRCGTLRAQCRAGDRRAAPALRCDGRSPARALP